MFPVGFWPPLYFPAGFWPGLDMQAVPPPDPFEVGLHGYLSAGLPVLVSPGHIARGDPLPAVSYFALSEDPYYYLHGGATGLTRVVIQFDCWATDHRECVNLERSLRGLLHGFRGMMGSTFVSGCRLQNRLSQYEAAADESDLGTHHLAVEYSIHYREAVPAF